jgi:crossover junction endodeoxyribonuclease RuvC
MKVLAIDPGYDRLGVAIMEHGTSGEVLIHSECILTDKTLDLNERLHTLGSAVEILLKEHKPDCVGIETLFFNKNIKTALGVAQARGIIIYLAQQAGCKVYEFGPQEIKIAVTGYGKSDKSAVIDMVKRLIPSAPEKALDDEYDAIAVGITTLAHHR